VEVGRARNATFDEARTAKSQKLHAWMIESEVGDVTDMLTDVRIDRNEF